MAISLRRLDEASGEWHTLSSFVTNDDGRLTGGPALKGMAFTVGTYEWTFAVGDYFAAAGVPIAGGARSAPNSRPPRAAAHLAPPPNVAIGNLPYGLQAAPMCR